MATPPQRLYLNHTLDDPWMARPLARHGLTGGRFTIVVLLVFHAAGLPLPVVRDFLGTLGELDEPREVLDKAHRFVRPEMEGRGTMEAEAVGAGRSSIVI